MHPTQPICFIKATLMFIKPGHLSVVAAANRKRMMKRDRFVSGPLYPPITTCVTASQAELKHELEACHEDLNKIRSMRGFLFELAVPSSRHMATAGQGGVPTEKCSSE